MPSSYSTLKGGKGKGQNNKGLSKSEKRELAKRNYDRKVALSARTIHACRAENIANVAAILKYGCNSNRLGNLEREYPDMPHVGDHTHSDYREARCYSNAKLFWDLINRWYYRPCRRDEEPVPDPAHKFIVQYLIREALTFAANVAMKGCVGSNRKYEPGSNSERARDRKSVV